MEFPRRKNRIYYHGGGMCIRDGGFIDFSTIGEIGNAVGTLAATGKEIHNAATVGNKKDIRHAYLQTLDDSDGEEIESIRDREDAAKLVKKMRNMVARNSSETKRYSSEAKKESKIGKGVEYFK
jgi:hypothetical protein